MVLQAFKKFDKDGNGSIDLQELGQLSAALGQPLQQDQLEAAMKDLDLNRNGVLDAQEFSRWYFSGMRSYRKKTRRILRMRN